MYMISVDIPLLENTPHYTDCICTRHVALLRHSPSPRRRQSELPRPIKIRPRMYVRRSIVYEKAAFCSPEENSSVAQ